MISARTYVSAIAAVKAWNRATGRRFYGESGGWIYRTSDNARICQGWEALAARNPRLTITREGYTAYRWHYAEKGE